MDSLLLEPPGGYVRYLEIPGDDCPWFGFMDWGARPPPTFHRLPPARPWPVTAHSSSTSSVTATNAPDAFGYTLEDHAQSVARVLDHVSLKGSAVFGHSMGGSVAITLAALRPDLVSRLIIAEGNLDPGGGFVSTGIAEQTERGFETTGTGRSWSDSWAKAG
jgi:pimeloyl-ACP methyl ester carboxylesterase